MESTNGYVIVSRVYDIIAYLLDKHTIFQEGFLHSYFNPERGIDDSKRDYFYIRQQLRGSQSEYTFSFDDETNSMYIEGNYYLIASLDSVNYKRTIEILVSDLEGCFPGVSVQSVADDPYYIFFEEMNQEQRLTSYLPLMRISMTVREPFNSSCKEVICKEIC